MSKLDGTDASKTTTWVDLALRSFVSCDGEFVSGQPPDLPEEAITTTTLRQLLVETIAAVLDMLEDDCFFEITDSEDERSL